MGASHRLMTAQRTCAKCGKKGEWERLCPACYLSEHTLLKSFKPVDAEFCAKCGKLHLANKWVTVKGVQDAFSRIVQKNAKPNSGVSVKALEVLLELPEHTVNEGVSVKGEADLIVRADVPEVKTELTDQYRIPVRLHYTLCTHCGKAGTQYFEGALQLRNASDEVRDEIRREIMKHASEGVHLTKEENVKGGGVDFYVTSGKFLRRFATELHNRYGGELKLSSELYSRDRLTSREMHRVKALVRLPDFTKGDVIRIDGKIIQVTSVSAKLYGTDLATGRRMTVQYAGKDITKLEKRETQISRVRPTIEVLDPDTYQSVAVENQQKAKELQPGKKVQVVKSAGRIYLLS